MKRHNDLSAQTVLTNEINKGKNDRKFSGILIMSPENESEQTCKDKMYKIYEENTPWVVKNIRAADCSLSENQSDCNTLEQNSSQDTCATVSSEEIDSCHSDISTMDHQDSINEKITQFLKWDIKEPIQKQQNEHNFGSLNSDQSQCRLLSGLDDNSQNPGDKKNNIEKTDSCHVCWNEYVEYYSYPLESSMSTIDMYTDSPKTKDIPRTRSHDYYTTLNDINKQQSEILITEVQKRPLLWDTSNEEYKDKNKKNSAWLEIALSLLSNCNKENEAQQKLILEDIMAKWRTIRDNYARNFKKIGENSKSGSGAKKIRLYIYAEQLSFLSKTKDLRNTESNFDHVSTAEEEMFSFDDNEQPRDDCRSPPTSSETAKAKTKFKKPDVERSLIDFMENHKTSQKPLENDDLAFFYSLLPSVQSLNMEHKFTFRMKTMQLLYSLQNNQTANQSMQRPSTVNVPTHRPGGRHRQHRPMPGAALCKRRHFLGGRQGRI